MNSRFKVLRFISSNINDNETKSSYSLYHSNSFIIRYYAYLPFIFSLKKVDFNKHLQVLDMGCSDGPFLPTLNMYAKKIIAMDIDIDLVRKSKNLIKNKLSNSNKINLMTSDGLKLPFRNEHFDLIFCLEVLEHVKNSRKVIEEIYRILKKNGELICTIPVEIGPSLFIREVLGKIIKFNRPYYTAKELIQNAFLKKPAPRTLEMGHKNFDWRLIKNEVKQVFGKIKAEFIPIKILRDFNPIFLIKAIKY